MYDCVVIGGGPRLPLKSLPLLPAQRPRQAVSLPVKAEPAIPTEYQVAIARAVSAVQPGTFGGLDRRHAKGKSGASPLRNNLDMTSMGPRNLRRYVQAKSEALLAALRHASVKRLEQPIHGGL